MSKLTYERAKQLYTPYDEGQMRHLCALRDVEIDRLQTENDKLRELVRDYIDAPCTTCDCWQDEFRCWNYDGADCGLVARAHDLGVEVDA